MKNARIVTIDESNEDTIANLSDAESIEEIVSMVSEYYIPRDVERIVTGMEENHRIPYPVVLQGSKGMYIMSGNTRNNVARVLGVTQKALLVDISE